MKNALRPLPALRAETHAAGLLTRFPSAPVVLTSASRTRPAASADGNAHKHLVTMKTVSLLSSLGALSVATTLFLNASAAQAQERPGGPGGPGGFNPEQMRERMLERLRESFDVKDDAEWKLISERIAKVMDTRRAAGGMGGGPGLGGGPGGPGGQRGFGGGRPPGGDDAGGPNGGRPPQGERGQGGPGGFNRQADPEAEALQKSLEAKAPTEEIKAKLAKLRDARRAKEALLDKAQEELRQILSGRQEAVAVAAGLLK